MTKLHESFHDASPRLAGFLAGRRQSPVLSIRAGSNFALPQVANRLAFQ
jgi:hypothetical protein